MPIRKYMAGHKIKFGCFACHNYANCIWDKFCVDISKQSKVMAFWTMVNVLSKVQKPLQTSDPSVNEHKNDLKCYATKHKHIQNESQLTNKILVDEWWSSTRSIYVNLNDQSNPNEVGVRQCFTLRLDNTLSLPNIHTSSFQYTNIPKIQFSLAALLNDVGYHCVIIATRSDPRRWKKCYS